VVEVRAPAVRVEPVEEQPEGLPLLAGELEVRRGRAQLQSEAVRVVWGPMGWKPQAEAGDAELVPEPPAPDEAPPAV
jgi:hypothetical protein